MNRFIPTLFVVVAVFVFGSSQFGFAQIQIVDGDGQQVTPNEIPAETVDEPPVEQAPGINPQILGGNGSSIIIRKSFSSVDKNGDRKTESSGKAIVIGPDGKRQEFDLGDGENMELDLGFGLGQMRIDGLPQGAAAKKQVKSFSLGLQCKPVHPAVASQLNLETGLMVSHVPTGSPAATAGVQLYDVLLYADDKQLNRKTDLSQAVKAAGEADAGVSLTLIRGGKEISVTVKPEKRLAGQVNRDLLNQNLMNGMLKLDFGPDEFFGEDALGKGAEARMRQQAEKIQEHVRRMQEELGNGLLEIPRPRLRIQTR